MSQPAYEAGSSQDSGVSPVSESTSAPESQGGGNQGTGVNPVWTAALEGVPAEFHPKLQEHFGKWDSNYQRMQQQYAPYKQFTQFEPQHLSQAWAMREMLNNNPMELYRRLTQALGLNEQQSPGEFESEEEDSPFRGEDEDPRWTEFKQRQDALDAQQQQIAEFIQGRAESEVTEQWTNAFEQQIEALRQQHGDFDIEDVLTRASHMDDPDIGRAFQEQQNFLRREFQRSRSTANVRAPLVQPTTGGIPSSAQKDPAEYTKEERAEIFRNAMNLSKG